MTVRSTQTPHAACTTENLGSRLGKRHRDALFFALLIGLSALLVGCGDNGGILSRFLLKPGLCVL
jgi:hypothetical protein